MTMRRYYTMFGLIFVFFLSWGTFFLSKNSNRDHLDEVSTKIKDNFMILSPRAVKPTIQELLLSKATSTIKKNMQPTKMIISPTVQSLSFSDATPTFPITLSHSTKEIAEPTYNSEFVSNSITSTKIFLPLAIKLVPYNSPSILNSVSPSNTTNLIEWFLPLILKEPLLFIANSPSSMTPTPTASLSLTPTATATASLTKTPITSTTQVSSSLAPSHLSVIENNPSSFRLTWQDNSENEEQFVIYYSTDGNYFLNHGTVSANTISYVIDGLACGTTYYFQIYARGSNTQGWLGASNMTTVTTAPCMTATISSEEELITVNCNELITADTLNQVSIVESDSNCASNFIYLFEKNPMNYIDAFYALIPSKEATDALFIAVYEEQIADRFRFSSVVVEHLYSNLPAAISACGDYERCSDWSNWPLSALYSGQMYQCPDLSRLDEAGLLQSLPYGDYSCTELTGYALKSVASQSTISQLSDMSRNHQWAWSRRNAVRVLGRFAELPESEVAHVLVTDTYSNTVQDALLNRLETETAQNVLNDTIWVLDSLFYPNFEMQPLLENISLQADSDVNLRFRAMAAISRLINAKSGLISEHDLDFLIRLLESDNVWIRAQAAFTFQVLSIERLDESRQTLIKEAIKSAWTNEKELIGRAYLARGLDRYFETTYYHELRDGYETAHLVNSLQNGNILIRSGLPQEELEPFLTQMQGEQKAFFDFFGQLFETPVISDTNDMITLKLFATKDEYQDYMNAFVGYAAGAGGIYVERDGTFYTYEREVEQSAFTVEELIQHEFGHYLQGRYVFPGLWTDPNYHEEPKAWADEGLSEFLASFTFDENGNYTYTTRDVHLDKLCHAPHRDLASLLAQREGYDEHGTFDYANGWAFMFYLITRRLPSAVNLFTSFRDGSYTLENFAAIAGVSSVSEVEKEWHNTIDWWCQVSHK